MELDAIGVDVFVFSKGGIQNAIWRGRPLGVPEKENQMEDEFDLNHQDTKNKPQWYHEASAQSLHHKHLDRNYTLETQFSELAIT